MLTEEQAETIESPDENKLVCALPGSGKTHTFINLVEKILKRDPTYTVLMVTFTNASAKEMSERILSRLGVQMAKRVTANTFASLMLSQFKRIGGRRKALIGPEQYTFVKRALAREKVRYDDIDDWMTVIDQYGRQIDFSFDGTPSAKVYEAYCEILRKYNRYDLNMMARELVAGLNSGMVKPYPHTHLLCDEFQDTDNLQYEWLAIHGRQGRRLAVVGDDDQSIYSWRGSLGYKAFVRFQQEFDAAGYLLSTCFRCKGNILHSARGFIENNDDRIPKEMRSIKESEGNVNIVEISNQFISQHTIKQLEADTPEAIARVTSDKKKKDSSNGLEHFRFVAQQVQESNNNGWAVLARTNKHLDSVEAAFTELGVDTVRIGGKSVFDNEHAIGIISLFCGVVNRSSLNELITGLGWVGETEARLHDVYVSSQLYGFAAAQPSGNSSFAKPTEFFQELSSIAQSVSDKDTEKFIHRFFQGVLRVIKKTRDPQQKLQEAVCELCRNITLGVKGPLHLRAKNLMQRSQKNKAKKDIKNPNVVVLATMNGSKGLEWPRVWIIEVEKGKVPLLKEETQEAIEEERRLLYVAMTRAEEELFISHREGKESEFIHEIQAQHSGQ